MKKANNCLRNYTFTPIFWLTSLNKRVRCKKYEWSIQKLPFRNIFSQRWLMWVLSLNYLDQKSKHRVPVPELGWKKGGYWSRVAWLLLNRQANYRHLIVVTQGLQGKFVRSLVFLLLWNKLFCVSLHRTDETTKGNALVSLQNVELNWG